MRACDRIALRDGVAIERESHADPTPLLMAVGRDRARGHDSWLRVRRTSRRA